MDRTMVKHDIFFVSILDLGDAQYSHTKEGPWFLRLKEEEYLLWGCVQEC